jgi:hypothetical protein
LFCFTMGSGLDGEIGRHSGLKIRRLPNSGVPVRFRLEAPMIAGREPARQRRRIESARARWFDSGSRHQKEFG